MPFAAIGYVVICALAGAATLGYSLVQKRRLRASESWVPSTAKVTKSDLVVATSSDSTEYRVSLAYEYLVDGTPYVGQRIGFGPRSFVRKKSAQAELDRYPLNANVPVYFDPANPKEAVLVREAPFNRLYFVVGILSLVLAAGIVVFSAVRSGS